MPGSSEISVGRDLGAEQTGVVHELSFATKVERGREFFLESGDKGLSNHD